MKPSTLFERICSAALADGRRMMNELPEEETHKLAELLMMALGANDPDTPIGHTSPQQHIMGMALYGMALHHRDLDPISLN